MELSRIRGTVKMVLEEVHLASPEEIERVRLEAEQEPETDVDDAGEQLHKLELSPKPKDDVEQMFWAMRRQFPEMVEAFKSAPFSGGGHVVSGPVPISQLVELYLTPKQYADLREPPLLSILKVSLHQEYP